MTKKAKVKLSLVLTIDQSEELLTYLYERYTLDEVGEGMSIVIVEDYSDERPRSREDCEDKAAYQ